ncbi:MAG: helix-turn-helix transcriptional regulator [Bacteroidales bacterium]|nr:helix-turn-helix transcriptional regulator [Bacteroidales bacterium]
MDNNSIKDNIRRIRKTRKLTQEDVALRLGISLTAYRDLERGSTAIMNGNLSRLAEEFDTSTEELVLGYKPSQQASRTLEEVKGQYQSRVCLLEKQVEDLEKLVRTLEETIASKNEIIENNKEIITMLKKELGKAKENV